MSSSCHWQRDVPCRAQAAAAGFFGEIMHPTEGYAVVGKAAGIGGMIHKAALPAGGKGMGKVKGCGHGASLA